FDNADLIGAPDVVDLARGAALHRGDQAGRRVSDVTEASRLPPVAMNGDGRVADGRSDERRRHPAIVDPHPWAVRIEDAHDTGIGVALANVRDRQRLRETLALVVLRARADRIGILPVRLTLWVLE